MMRRCIDTSPSMAALVTGQLAHHDVFERYARVALKYWAAIGQAIARAASTVACIHGIAKIRIPAIKTVGCCKKHPPAIEELRPRYRAEKYHRNR